MDFSTNCRFCDIAAGKYHYYEIDEPFASNDEFIAVASIGALVEGWTLIVPRTHQLSMRNIYRNSIFIDLVNSIVPSLVQRYGSVIAFEHGANKDGSITACGTDHAHLHLVPLGESLLPELQESDLQWVQCYSSEIALKSGLNEYLFYCDLENQNWKNPIGYLHVLKHPLSQFFRRLIAKRRGALEVFDYKLFPYLDTAKQTRKALVGSFSLGPLKIK